MGEVMGEGGEGGTAARRAAAEIVRTLRAAGHVAYFAGGCVRDELLGIEPQDYDVATDATPRRVKELMKRTEEVGAAFGVVLVKPGKGMQPVEVATFRSDGPYSDRRRPDSVTFSDEKSDAARRDFTVNALFLDPSAETQPAAAGLRAPVSGRVVDHVGGVKDLAARVIRAVGDPEKRLAEDHLRALRAVRLVARLGFRLEEGTASAIRRHARELGGISRERIGEEVRRMLSHATRARAVELMDELELSGPVLGEAESKARGAGVLAGIGDGGRVSVAMSLAAWALSRGLEPRSGGIGEFVARARSALCLSNDETEDVRNVLEAVRLIEGSWGGLGVAGQKRAAVSAGFAAGLRLAGVRNADMARGVERRIEELRGIGPGLEPVRLLGGEDLIGMGMKPGPAFRRLLEDVYDGQLEGRVSDREGALRLARDLAGSMGV